MVLKFTSATTAVEATAQFSAIATLFLFLGLATNGFSTASKTQLDYDWTHGKKDKSPAGVVAGFCIMGCFYLVAAGFAAYVAYTVSTANFAEGDLNENEKARVKLLKQRLTSLNG
jgi:hypothetical protein